jgi:hypothetical protein
MRLGPACIYILSSIIPIASCKEVYAPDELTSAERIPVIQGRIQEGGVPSVSLTWALAYAEQTAEAINGANVVVTDDLGREAMLEETQNGIYTLASKTFIGEQGRTYTLTVELPDGSVYASLPQYIESPPLIDSIYASPVTRTVQVYNYYNQPIPEIQEGLQIQVDVSDSAESVRKYRFSTKVIKETVVEIGKGNAGSISLYRWELSYLDNASAVNSTVPFNGLQVLRQHQAGFLRFFIDRNLETETTSAPYILGWIIVLGVSPVSDDVYTYYNSIADQLRSNTEMFAPVPSQVKSNIHCTNDPARLVTGVFEASSVTSLCKVFAWKNLDRYKSMELTNFADTLKSGYQYITPPDFFVIL